MTDWTTLTAQAHDALFTSPLAEGVTFTPSAGAPVAVRGLFSLELAEVDAESGVEVLSQRPNLRLQLASLAAPPEEGDEVEARGVAYRVSEVRPDGDGAVLLVLHRRL